MKIDCVLCQLQDTVAAALSTKSELSLRIHALGPCRIWCCYLQGKVVGQVDVSTGDTIAQAVREAGHALADDSDVPVNIAVRTIKRDPSSQVVTSVQVRVTDLPLRGWTTHVHSASQVEPILEGPELEDLEKDGRLVSQAQFEAIAGSAYVQNTLGDAALREVLAAIDAAPSRPAALAAAMANPLFANFCDSILDIVSPA